MIEPVNDILQKINSLGYKILQSSKLKKDSKKPVEPSFVYKENLNLFGKISLEEFESFIKIQAKNIYQENIINPSSITNLLSKCGFIYNKFRWFVTSDRTKIYYEKTREDAEEYNILTTDRDSFKFFNVLSNDDLLALTEFVIQYNSEDSNKENPVNEEKVVKLIMEDLRKNPAFRLEKEPVTLSNSPFEPCFKYFDMIGLKKWGDDYCKEQGQRPQTPAWDQFFLRVRDQNMVPLIKAFLCGIFVAKNRAKQCLYIWGAGNDGKSQITAALTECLGERVTFIFDQYMRSNNFSSYDAFGKRLAIGEELSAPNIIKNKIFHAITGQSLVRIEPKGEQAFHARLYACAVVTSNEKPLLEDVKNQTTRLLYVEVDSASDEEINASGVNWGQALQTEIQAMIYDGIKFYKHFNPDGGSYRMPQEYEAVLSDLHDDETIHIQEFVEKCFIEKSDGMLIDRLGDAFREYVTTNYFSNQTLPKEYLNNQISRKIFEKLKIRFPEIKKERKKIQGEVFRLLIGLDISKKFQGLNSIMVMKEKP